MGRFFQTAPTQFVEDYIYQPPWELIQQAAAKEQQIYDAAVASTKIFDNLQIDHLQGEDDVYNVKEKQRYYAENAANIAKAIQNNPSKARQYMNNIEALSKELQKDMTTGDLSKIIGSAQAYKKWQEDNKKLKEDDASRYTAAERAYLGDYLNAGGNSLFQGFRGEQVTKGIDYEAIRKSLGELKANKIKSTRQTPGGGLYMVETENGLEEMSEERMNGWMLSQILSPENLASLSQSEKFGLGTYRNSEGKIDYDNGSLFAPLRGFARAGHYSQQENSFKMSANTAAIAQMNEAGTNNRFWAEMNYKKNKDAQDRIDKEKSENQKDMWETTKLAYDPNTSPELRQAAQARLSSYYGLGDNINIKNKDYGSIGDVLKDLKNPTNKTLAINYFKQKAQDANKNKSNGDYFMYKNLETAIRTGKITDLNSFTTEANKIGEQGLKLGYNIRKESEENPIWGNIKNILGAGFSATKTFTGFGDDMSLDRTTAFNSAKNYLLKNEHKIKDSFAGFIINDSKTSFGAGGNYNERNINLGVEYIAPEKSINILNNFNNPNYRNNFTFYPEGSNKSLSSNEVKSLSNFQKYGVAGASPYGDNTNVLVDGNGNKYVAVANNASIESNSLQQIANYNNYKFLPANSQVRNNIYNSVTNYLQAQALNMASKNPGEVSIFLPNPYTTDNIKFNKNTGKATIIDMYGNTEELPNLSSLATTLLNR